MKNNKVSSSIRISKFSKFELCAFITLILCTIINWINISQILIPIYDVAESAFSAILPVCTALILSLMIAIAPLTTFTLKRSKIHKIIGVLTNVFVLLMVGFLWYMRIINVVTLTYSDFSTFSSIGLTLLYTAVMLMAIIVSILIGSYKTKSIHKIISAN